MTIIIRDSFVGPLGNTLVAPLYRGNLYPQNKQGLIAPTDHVSESGHVWYKGWENADIQLSGDGRAWPDYPQNSADADAWCPTPMPSTDYFVELDVNIPANDDSGWVVLYFKIEEKPNADYGAESSRFGRVQWLPVNGASSEIIYIGDEGSLFTGMGTVTLSAGVFGDHTLRVECRGDVAHVFTDGIWRGSRTMTGSWRNNAETYVGFGGKSRTSDLVPPGIQYKEFRAGTLKGLFWQNHQRTVEVE